MARADHIYVNRLNGMYNHHGIDCGDGGVIHYTSDSWRRRRRIQLTSLEEFAGGDEIRHRDYDEFQRLLSAQPTTEQLFHHAERRINTLLDTLRGLSVTELDFSADAVMQRAESRLRESSFDLFSNNCEHFAAWCKTGISNSNQINEIWRASLSGPKFARRRAQHFVAGVFGRR